MHLLAIFLRGLFASLGRQLFAFKTYLMATIFIGGAQFFAAMTKKVLLALGIGFVTYRLGSYGLDYAYDLLSGSLSDLPSDALVFLKLARVDEAISILFGAISARITLMGFSMAEKRQSVAFHT